MAETGLVQILEGALMVAGEALSIQRLSQLFDEFDRPANTDLREALDEVGRRCEGRGYELVQVATGYRFQVRQNLSTWVGRLWQERPPRYSRALLETLSLIAYRQPITRGEIEEIRGVAFGTNTLEILMELNWVKPQGRKDVPGKPIQYATTDDFLSHFSLQKLSDLPTVDELGSAGLIDSSNIDNAIFGTGKFYKEKQEEKKEDIYENIDEMLSSTLNSNEDK